MNKKINTDTYNKAVADVLDLFSQIDLKIIDLHNCSSQDFLSLNSALKDNYKKANMINGITESTFEKIGENGSLLTIKNAKNDFLSLKKLVSRLDKKVDYSLENIDSITANLNMVPIPLNNFAQNLSVLKLIFSNIKLTNSFFDNSNKYFDKKEIHSIETAIDKIKKHASPVEDKNLKLQPLVNDIYTTLINFREDILGNLLQIIDKVLNELEILEKHNVSALKNYEQISFLSKQCSDNVESIITNLQYHDIIRQKMEHVQRTHQLIIEELNIIDNPGAQSKEASQIFSFALQIPKISEIQTAQLLHANKEFQHAIDQITGKMNEIGQNINQIARIYSSLAIFKHHEEEISLDKLELLFTNFIETCAEGESIASDITEKSKEIYDLFLMIQDEFHSIDSMDNVIEQNVIEKINIGKVLLSSTNEAAEQAQQIIKLYADNRFEKNKLRYLFHQITEQINLSNAGLAQLQNPKQGFSSFETTAKNANSEVLELKKVFDYLIKNKDLIFENSIEISKQNKNAVKEAKYYAYFDKTIDDIISKFNKISDIIKSSKLAEIKLATDENSLKKIEEYYTMKTERIIHNQTMDVQSENETEISENDNERKGNDVEFF